jgi:hypothetical protein
MERRQFSREFKLEAVKLVRERGVSVAQAARDLDVHVLRNWGQSRLTNLVCSNLANSVAGQRTPTCARLEYHSVAAET